MTTRKKLIEVALPLEAINEEGSRRKRKAPSGYPTALHKWWAQRPVAAARAVTFAQMVDDPSAWPDLFPTEKKQEQERQRLFRIIEDLIQWDNTSREEVFQTARDEIWRSWRRACAENVGHPEAKELFDRDKLPAFHDPFAGGGTLPLEAQRLGLDVLASDLNPIAVLINKAMVEIPPALAGRPPINPSARKNPKLFDREWKGVEGLAEDIRYYAELVRTMVAERIGSLFPPITIAESEAALQPALIPLIGESVPVVAWFWVQTIKSPNPAFRDVEVPLATTFLLSSKPGREAYVVPVIEGNTYRFEVRIGKPVDSDQTRNGTKLGRGANFRCVMSGAVINDTYVKAESMAGRLGVRLMAVVAESKSGRVYLSPNEQQSRAAQVAVGWKPDLEMNRASKDLVSGRGYGVFTWGDLFTNRQALALDTFAEAINHVCREDVETDLSVAVGTHGKTYSAAVRLYLVFALSRMLHHSSKSCTWLPKDSAIRQTFSKQAIPVTWDFVEGNPFGKSSAEWMQCVKVVSSAVSTLPAAFGGKAFQANAASSFADGERVVISTDPPYYDNVSYADLSDYFYVWLRRAMRDLYPDLFATVAVPKDDELVASSHRHGGSAAAERFFLQGMTDALGGLAKHAHPAFPITIYYAFKQTEETDGHGLSSTGWETFLEAVIRSGFAITGTWPMRTEGDNRQVSVGTNALASSIVLVCRKREEHAPQATRREFLLALQKELPEAMANLQRGNVAPVDLQQAAIGPGMAIFTRYSRILDADGNSLSIREALSLINQSLDEVLAHQEGDFDSDTRWALAWFEQFGFVEGDYDSAETLSKAKNTSVEGIRIAGIGTHGKGKVRLFKPEELPAHWNPDDDKRLTVWDMVHHLIRTLEQGEEVAAALLAQLGTRADIARELAYRLYSICERKKRSADAQRYNALVQSWPELLRLAQQAPKVDRSVQGGLFE